MKRFILISLCVTFIICSAFNFMNISRIYKLNSAYLNKVSFVDDTNLSKDNVNISRLRALCVKAVSLLSVTSEAEYNSFQKDNSIEPSVVHKYIGTSFENYVEAIRYYPSVNIYDVMVEEDSVDSAVAFVNLSRQDTSGVYHSEVYKISIRNNTVVGMHKIGDLK